MSIDVVADGLTAYRLGQASFALIFPIAGALLLGFGIHRRRAFNRWNRHDDDRLLRSQPSTDDAPQPSPPPSKGTALIVTGAVILLLGAGHVLSYLAVSRTTQSAGNVEATCPDGSRNSARYPANCTDPAATVKVASRVDGASEAVGCPTMAKVVSHLEPRRVYCFVAP